jgi:hypothetical protein
VSRIERSEGQVHHSRAATQWNLLRGEQDLQARAHQATRAGHREAPRAQGALECPWVRSAEACGHSRAAVIHPSSASGHSVVCATETLRTTSVTAEIMEPRKMRALIQSMRPPRVVDLVNPWKSAELGP